MKKFWKYTTLTMVVIAVIVFGAVACGTPPPTAVTKPAPTPPPPNYDWLNESVPHSIVMNLDCSNWATSDDPKYIGLIEDSKLISSTFQGAVVTQTWVIYLDHIHIDDVTVFLASESVIRNWDQNGQAQVLNKTPYLDRAKELSLLAPNFTVTSTATWEYSERAGQYAWSYEYDCQPPVP